MTRDARPEELPEISSAEYAAMTLGEFIEAASGGEFKAPYHLGEYFDLMSGLYGGQLRICVSCPPQHGKTTLIHFAIVWTLLRNPKLRFAYASHGKEFSNEQSGIMRDLFLACGGQIKKDHNTKAQWKTEQGGGLLAASHESAIIGRKLDVLVCDDLIPDPDYVEKVENRDHVSRWLHGVAAQRLWVGGSVVVIGSRWHHDDPSGRLIAKGYREINMQAVREDEHGIEHALWPEVKSLAWLNTLRLPSSVDFLGEHEWQAAYQGKPVPRTGALFGAPRWFDELPAGAICVSIGVDVAYEATTSADWSVVVVLFWLNGIFYVWEVRRVQQSTVEVQAMLEQVMKDYPGVRLASYVSGPEKGVLNLLFHAGVPVERMPARTSKWSRSQRASIAWKAGRILVRRGQPWSTKFAREVEFFTGQENAKDDQTDALVSGFDLVEASAPVGWAGAGFKFGKAVA